jgi:hypothetical protein
MKRKRKKTASPEERAARRARMEERVRELREHEARIRAELAAGRAAEDSAG